MSVISGANSTRTGSSILRKTSSIKSKLSVGVRTPVKVRFLLPHSSKVRHILQKFAQKDNTKDYENLVCLIRDAHLIDDDIISLLDEASECISVLNQNLRLFVEATLSIQWIDCSQAVIEKFQSFLVDLLSAHNYHAKYALDVLVRNFLPGSEEEAEWSSSTFPEEELKKYIPIHYVINTLLDVVPMCKDLLMQSIVSHFPYMKKSTHAHELYIHNVLLILKYRPQFRPDILHLMISKLVLLDVNAPKEDIERLEHDYEMDEGDCDDVFHLEVNVKSFSYDSSCDKMKHPLAHTLDVCLDILLKYFRDESEVESGEVNWDKTKVLYRDAVSIFDKILLPTYNIHHVQFVMFYLCSFKPTFTEAFLNYLWKKVCTATVPSVHRHTAATYIASLIARGTFIPLSMIKGTLQQMAEWIHSYSATQDGLECINSDLRVHNVFYSVCQGLFYIVAFRHRELVKSKKNIVFLESLNLAKIVTSRLNPLRVCQPAVVQNFASVMRTYQLAYCYAIIEHNARNVMPIIFQDDRGSVLVSNNILDSYFPFDPYILRRSGKQFEQIYLNYQLKIEKESSLEGKDDVLDLDDFLSYGTSPGFKYKG